MKTVFLLLLLLCHTVLVAQSRQADAQSKVQKESEKADSEPTISEKLSPIQVTASRLVAGSNDAMKAITIITRDDIKNKPNTLLPDLLRNETGVYIQQTTPGQAIPIIRGLKGSQNLHLVDGMRLNTAFFRNAPNQYFALVDPLMTEQIEVIRGPGSVLYGGDALGGVVNVLTYTPDFQGSQLQIQGQLASVYNSADEQWINHINIDAGNEQLATTLGLSYQDVGSRTTGSGQTLPFTTYSARAANNKWVFRPNDNSRWVFDLQYLRQPATPRVDDLVAGFGQTEPDSKIFLFRPNERYFSHLNYTTTAATKIYDEADWHLAWQKIIDGRYKQGYNRSRIDTEQNISELFGLQADFNKGISPRSQIVYGFEVYEDTISSAKQRTDDGQTEIVESRFPDQSKMQQWALFADYHISAGDHNFSVGGRYSDYRIDLNSPELNDDVLNVSDVTWQLGWLYKINTADRLFANISRGFRPPNIFDLGQVGERPNNRFNVINPDLSPETVVTFDLGWKHAGGGWQSELVAFVSDYENVITSALTGETTSGGHDIVQSQNVSEVRLWGLEGQFNRYFLDGSHLYANLTYTWGEQSDDQTEEPADRTPPLFGAVGYYWPLSDSLNWRNQFRYADAQNRLSSRDVRDARINPLGTGGFVVYDTHLTWQLGLQATVRVGIENLFDKKYREHASGLDAPGRSYHASFYYDF